MRKTFLQINLSWYKNDLKKINLSIYYHIQGTISNALTLYIGPICFFAIYNKFRIFMYCTV